MSKSNKSPNIFDKLRSVIFDADLDNKTFEEYLKEIEETNFITGLSILSCVLDKTIYEIVGLFLYALQNRNLSEYYKFINNKRECVKFIRSLVQKYDINKYCFNYKTLKSNTFKRKEDLPEQFIKLMRNTYLQSDDFEYVKNVAPELLNDDTKISNNIIILSENINLDESNVKIETDTNIIDNNTKSYINIRNKIISVLNSKFTDNCLYKYCEKCSLRNNPFVPPDFIINNPESDEIDIMIVGMNPYKEEIEQGKPFVGDSGKILRYVLNEVFKDKNIVITNACMCFIENNGDPTRDNINRCRKLLYYQIKHFNPKIIIPLGKIAIEAVLNEKIKSVTKIIGKLINKGDKIVIPNYHPSYILRKGGRKLLSTINDD